MYPQHLEFLEKVSLITPSIVTNQLALVPKILQEESLLTEIQQLRVLAYENSERQKVINQKFYKNGWGDTLDDKSIHFVIEDKGIIVAASRLAFFTHLTEFPRPDILKPYGFSSDGQKVYLSRLVVHPMYRKKKLAYDLANYQMEIVKNLDLQFVFLTTHPQLVHFWLSLGFYDLGSFSFQLYPAAPLEQYHMMHQINPAYVAPSNK